MNILFVSEYYPPKIMGGGEINLQTLAQTLAKQGHKVHILTSQCKNLATENEPENLIIHRTLITGEHPASAWSNIKRSMQLSSSIISEIHTITKIEKIDLIHFIGISLIAAPKIKHLQIPLFATIESYPALCPKGDRLYHGKTECTISCTFLKFIACQQNSSEIGKMKNRFYFKKNPLFWSYTYHHYQKLQHALAHCQLISISSYVQKLLQQQGFKSTVIPNSLDLSSFLKAPPSYLTPLKPNKKKSKQKNDPAHKLRVLYLGSLLKSKGPHLVLEALKETNLHGDFYGEGPLKKEMQEYIDRHKIDATIHAPIPYSQIPSLYQQTDIVVFPSLWPEPFGRIAIEALAAGKLIIASKIGGIEETLKNSSALLVKPGDVRELHQALKQAIYLQQSQKKSRNKDHLMQIQQLQQQYDPQQIANSHIKL